jgi:ribonuclease R
MSSGDELPNLIGSGANSEAHSPWSKRGPIDDRNAGRRKSKHQQQIARQHEGELSGPIPEHVLHDIAEESSQAERRADDAERELIEWKKIKFMRDRVGDEFDALVISTQKYGFFVELTDMFVEGLVPINTLIDDRYTYRENTRQIMGERGKHAYSIGDRVRVLLDRIDTQQRKLQFSVVVEERRPTKKAESARERLVGIPPANSAQVGHPSKPKSEKQQKREKKQKKKDHKKKRRNF